MTPSPAPGASRILLTALVAFALVCTIVIGMFAGITNGPMSWGSVTAAMPKFLRLPSWDQWLFLGSWAALTGTLFAFGAGTTPSPLRTRLFALISGLVVPVGLVFLARFLSRYWPDTSGPFDSPPLTFYLALYGLLAPWLLGRVASTLSRAEAR